ncbi:MAG: hypothetical protein ACFB3T_09275 [Geminicoccaceae bacterium]
MAKEHGNSLIEFGLCFPFFLIPLIMCISIFFDFFTIATLDYVTSVSLRGLAQIDDSVNYEVTFHVQQAINDADIGVLRSCDPSAHVLLSPGYDYENHKSGELSLRCNDDVLELPFETNSLFRIEVKETFFLSQAD